MQCNPPQGLSSPDSQLRAGRSGAANPVSGVVPPECCRLLHLLTLLLTLWGECSHICLCEWCDSASGSDNLFHSNNHCSLDECLQRLCLIQISLALSYISLHKICLRNAAFKGMSSSWVSQNATLLFFTKVHCLPTHKDIYAQKSQDLSAAFQQSKDCLCRILKISLYWIT